MKLSPLSSARTRKISAAADTMSRRLKGAASSSARPASILDRSSMSDRMPLRDRPDAAISSAISRWLALRGVFSRVPAMATTPFRGVRSSWLILARNWDLAMLAASAWARWMDSSRREASSSVRWRTTRSSRAFRSEISRWKAIQKRNMPSSSGTGRMLRSTQKADPSRR